MKIYKERYDELKQIYLKDIKIIEKFADKIDYLEEIKFSINMIDRWDDDDRIAYNVVTDLISILKEAQKCEMKPRVE